MLREDLVREIAARLERFESAQGTEQNHEVDRKIGAAQPAILTA